jgi:hypothetical protein
MIDGSSKLTVTPSLGPITAALLGEFAKKNDNRAKVKPTDLKFISSPALNS